MAVSIEKNGPVWTVIHNRPEARNAMDPASADALTRAFLDFDADATARVAVFYGEGGAFWASSIFRPRGLMAMAARSRAVRWGPRGWSWTSPSLRQSRGPPSQEEWNLPSGAIFA